MATTKQPRRISAQRASAQIQQWINSGENQEDEEISTENSDEDVNVKAETEDVVEYQISEHDDASCSEDDSESDMPDDQPPARCNLLVSKDKRVEWSKTPVAALQGRRPVFNIVRSKRRIVIEDKVVDKPSDSVELYLDDKFFDIQLTFTNKKLKRRREAPTNSDTN